MLTNFELAIIVLLVVNLLATIYFNYRSQEDYEAEIKSAKQAALAFKGFSTKLSVSGGNEAVSAPLS